MTYKKCNIDTHLSNDKHNRVTNGTQFSSNSAKNKRNIYMLLWKTISTYAMPIET